MLSTSPSQSEADLNESTNDSVISRRVESTVSEKLKWKESQNLKEKIMNFIRDVQNQKIASDHRLPQRVVDLIENVEDEFQALWNEYDDIAAENGEFFEKIITKPLYSILMSLFDEQRDKSLEFAFKVFEFVQLKHLETDEEIRQHPKFEWVIKQLASINTFVAPKEKLQCIINGCKMISTILTQQSKNSQPTGADNFLPVLIYAVLQAKPANPFTNIEYIRNFRSSRRIAGVEEYYFTAYESAIEFIESLDHVKLKISAEEFKRLCSERVEGIKYEESVPEEGQFQFDAYQNYINLQMLKMKITEVQKTAKFAQQSKNKKLKFPNKTLNELTVGELPEFHAEYMQLYKNNLELQKQLDGLQKYTDQILMESHRQRNKQNQGKKKFFGLL